jgi:hypothetical protein
MSLGGPTSGHGDLKNRQLWTLPGLELQPLAPPARSQLLYRLRYRSSPPSAVAGINIALKTVD